MSAGRFADIRQQWHANRRLRLAVLVVLAILALHALDGLAAQRDAVAAQHEADMRLRERLELIGAQPEWIERADEAEAEFVALQRQLRTMASPGQAQAEVHSWLSEFATAASLESPVIKVQDVLEVPGHPELIQVLARIDGRLPAFGHAAFVRGVSLGLPWIQVERLEVGDQVPPRVAVVVRSYYRNGDEPADPVPVDAGGGGT